MRPYDTIINDYGSLWVRALVWVFMFALYNVDGVQLLESTQNLSRVGFERRFLWCYKVAYTSQSQTVRLFCGVG